MTPRKKYVIKSNELFNKEISRKTLIAIIIIFSFLMIVLFWINPAYSWDELAYVGMAHGYYVGLNFGTVTPTFTEAIFRPPLLTATLYLFYLLFGFSEVITKLVIPLFTVATTLAIYCFSKKFLSERLGLIAAALFATFPATIFFNYRVLAENYFSFLLISDLLFFFFSIKNKKFLIPLGIVLALTFLIKYDGLFVTIALFFATLLTDRQLLKNILFSRYFPVSILVFLLTLIPWMLFNSAEYKTPFGSATTQSNLLSTSGSGLLPFIRLVFPFPHYLIYWVFIVGTASIFILYGVLKYVLTLKTKVRSNFKKDDLASKMRFLSITLLILLLLNEVVSLDIRYIVYTLPLFALITAYAFQQLKMKLIPIIFLLLIFINVFAGYFVTYSFAYPRESSNLITKIIEIGPNKVRRFDEHLSYKEAAIAIKTASESDDKVISNGCLFVWFYSNRTCYWFGVNTEKNIQFKNLTTIENISNFVHDKQVKWMYVIKDAGDITLVQNLNKTQLYENNYVLVYELSN